MELVAIDAEKLDSSPVRYRKRMQASGEAE
jgi:hypothetical protein